MPPNVTLTCDEFLDLAAMVALDAAEAEDAERVEKHAAECPDCAARLREFREAAAALGSVVPQVDPPAALQARVFQALRATDQVRVRRLWPRAVRRARLTAPWLVAAASLGISIFAMVGVAMLQGQVMSLQRDAVAARERAARYDHVVEVLASDKLAIRPLQPVVQSMPSRGMVYMDPSSGTGMLMCHDLPTIEQGHAYQVWFVRGNERVSGGLLWPDRAGNGYALIQVPTDLQSFDSVGLTDEPGTGSAWPTTPRVIGTPLKESSQ
jgi:anti-sigma-K factor RskA